MEHRPLESRLVPCDARTVTPERGSQLRTLTEGVTVASDQHRLIAAESLAQRLDRPMGVLGIIFLLVVLAQLLVIDPTGQVVLTVISWVF